MKLLSQRPKKNEIGLDPEEMRFCWIMLGLVAVIFLLMYGLIVIRGY